MQQKLWKFVGVLPIDSAYIRLKAAEVLRIRRFSCFSSTRLCTPSKIQRLLCALFIVCSRLQSRKSGVPSPFALYRRASDPFCRQEPISDAII